MRNPSGATLQIFYESYCPPMDHAPELDLPEILGEVCQDVWSEAAAGWLSTATLQSSKTYRCASFQAPSLYHWSGRWVERRSWRSTANPTKYPVSRGASRSCSTKWQETTFGRKTRGVAIGFTLLDTAPHADSELNIWDFWGLSSWDKKI